MMKISSLSCILLGLLGSKQASAHLDRSIRSIQQRIDQNHKCVSSDCGDEVCITDYLLQGDSLGARKAAKSDVFPDVESYAGFALVNATAKNKLFFWYVPAMNGNETAPLLIWLQGGPGSSSLFGMFSEMGPFEVEKDGSLKQRATSWNKNYGMIFIDNPVGAGYSYTETPTGYCTNTKTQVSSQLYELMQQLYLVFPEQLKNPLFITGESYAGHYVPGLGHKIFLENKKIQADFYDGKESQMLTIPLAGLAIGDGWTDPYSQLAAYPDMLFNIGVANANDQHKFQQYTDSAREYIKQGQMYEAFTVWDEMINGDIYPYPNYYHNVTGSNDYDNFMNTNEPDSLSYYYSYVTKDATRKSIHVGNRTYNNGADCEMNLVSDFMVSFRSEMQDLIDNYKVLIYSGQLDVIIGAALTEKMLQDLEWSEKQAFTLTPKKVWRVTDTDPEVAGYVRQHGTLTHAIVRGAGHLVPFDQPERALDMMTRWVEDIPFKNLVNPL